MLMGSSTCCCQIESHGVDSWSSLDSSGFFLVSGTKNKNGIPEGAGILYISCVNCIAFAELQTNKARQSLVYELHGVVTALCRQKLCSFDGKKSEQGMHVKNRFKSHLNEPR